MFKSSVIVSILSILVTFASFVNQVVTARLLGADARMDTYLVAVSIPFLVMGMAGGVMSYAIVPILTARRVTNPDDCSRLAGGMLLVIVLMAIGFSALAFLISPILVTLLAPTLLAEQQMEASWIARVSWITVGCALVVNYLSAVQTSERRFVWPVLVNLLPYLGMIAVGSLGAWRIGGAALAWGMLGGNVLALVVLCFGVMHSLSFDSSIRYVWHETTPILATIPLVLVSTLCFAIFGTVDAFWASRLGAGNLSYLGYGLRIVIALGSFVIQGPSIVLAPYLAEAYAVGQLARFRHVAAQTLRMVIAFASLVGLMVAMLRTPIIELLFQRGAFDTSATLGLSSILPLMLVGMVAMLSVVTLLRVLHACRDLTSAAMIGGIGALLYFSLSGLFSEWFGLLGIVLAYAVTWWMLLGLAIWRIWREETLRIFAMHNLRFVLQLLASLVFCAAPTWLLWRFLGRTLDEVGPVNLGLRLVALAGFGSASFLSISAGLFRMPEIIVPMQRFPVLLFPRLQK